MSKCSSLKARLPQDTGPTSHSGQARARARKKAMRAALTREGISRDEFHRRRREQETADKAAALDMSVEEYVVHMRALCEQEQSPRRFRRSSR